MEVICIEEKAFYTLLEKVIQLILINTENEDKWISDKEAMRRLHIKSKSTLQKLRDTGEIRFSQPAKKHIVYDAASINAFFERHARKSY